MKIVIDTTAATLTRVSGDEEIAHGLYTKEAFEEISRQWVRVGWSLSYYHTFSWFGLPILQLPEDLIRLQEVIYRWRPGVIVETGIYQGGSLLFHASLLEAIWPEAIGLEAIGAGRVVGVDREIPAAVREAIASHPLAKRITLIEGDSTAPQTVAQVEKEVLDSAPVLVILDSGHSRDHVALELERYAPLVTPGSYIVATDGIMHDLSDVPRGQRDWATDNPLTAAREFTARHPEFVEEQPPWPCYTGPLTKNVTYWPGAWLKRAG